MASIVEWTGWKTRNLKMRPVQLSLQGRWKIQSDKWALKTPGSAWNTGSFPLERLPEEKSKVRGYLINSDHLAAKSDEQRESPHQHSLSCRAPHCSEQVLIAELPTRSKNTVTPHTQGNLSVTSLRFLIWNHGNRKLWHQVLQRKRNFP